MAQNKTCPNREITFTPASLFDLSSLCTDGGSGYTEKRILQRFSLNCPKRKTRQRGEGLILHLLDLAMVLIDAVLKSVMATNYPVPANNVALASIFHRQSLNVAIRQVLSQGLNPGTRSLAVSCSNTKTQLSDKMYFVHLKVDTAL